MADAATEFAHLLPVGWERIVASWLIEDTPSFDYGGFVVGEKEETAALLGKTEGVLAGVPFFDEVFRQMGCRVSWLLKEGDWFTPVTKIAIVQGPVRKILLGERPALNMIARASGIATRARKLQKIKEERGWNGIVAGTRKTTPGFRLVEKYAMLVGGVDGHRMDLSSMVMLKDNHVWSQGSITKAVEKAKAVAGFSLKIEVEVRNLAEAEEAVTAGANIVMLDNFVGEEAKRAASILKKKYPHVLIEGSGGITEDNIDQYMWADIDILSLGSLTQGVPHIDYSLKIQKDQSI